MTRVSGTERGQRRLNGVQTSGRTFRNLSAPELATREERDLAVPMRDGVTLLADVVRPTTEGRYPALIAFSPYPRQLQNSGAPLGFVEAGASDFWVPRGYAHVLANARGTCGSSGTYTLMDEQERRDLFDLVEWVAAQPWCDGSVGMIGISYFAVAQLMAASTRPPHLKAIFPLAATVDMYRGCVWHGGMLSARFVGAWLAGLGITSSVDQEAFRGTFAQLASKVLRTDAIHQLFESMNGERAIAGLSKVMRAKYDARPWDDLYLAAAAEHPLRDEFWVDREVVSRLGGVDIPVYLGCDWDNVPLHLPGTFAAWEALPKRAHTRMALLPRGGLCWPWESMHVEALAWFDHWLKGRDTGAEEGPPVRYWMHGAEQWRTAESWPPPELRWGALHLRADGALGAQAGEGAREYLYLPKDLLRPPNANPAPLPDRLSWETAPAVEPYELAGPLALELEASTTGLDTDWIAKLQLVEADGTARDLTQGWLRASHRAVDPAQARGPVPHHPHERQEPVRPGAVERYAIGLVPTAQQVAPGQRLRLCLASCDHHGFAMLGFDHAALSHPARQRILASSRLHLPVVGGSLPR